MKTVALGLAASLALLSAPMARAEEEKIDTSQIRIRKAIAERLTPEQLQARKERLARRIAAAREAAGRTAPGGLEVPADTCPAASHETSALPFGPVSDTTTGMTNDYQPALSSTVECSAPTNCTGRGLLSPRGVVYIGTGWGPDRAYRIQTNANCTLTIDLNPTDPPVAADDLGLLVYEAQCTNELVDCVCASDNGFPDNTEPNGNTEGVVLDALAGTDYFVVIDGYSTTGAPPGDAGPFTLTISGTGCNLVTPPSQYHTLNPCRLIDTRLPNGAYGGPPLTAGISRTFDVDAGVCGVPAGATAVFVNVTVSNPTELGNLRIFPTGAPLPAVAALNYSAGQVRGNNGLFRLSPTGQIDIRATQGSGTVDVIVDVAGYFLE